MIRRWNYLRTEPPVALIDPVGALRAVSDSRQRLAEEKCRSGRTLEVTSRLKELQDRNHFADLLESAMGHKDGHRGTRT